MNHFFWNVYFSEKKKGGFANTLRKRFGRPKKRRSQSADRATMRGQEHLLKPPEQGHARTTGKYGWGLIMREEGVTGGALIMGEEGVTGSTYHGRRGGDRGSSYHGRRGGDRGSTYHGRRGGDRGSTYYEGRER